MYLSGEGNDAEKYDLNLPSVVDVLTQYLLHNSVQTKVAVLRWIHHLYTKLPHKVDKRPYFIETV